MRASTRVPIALDVGVTSRSYICSSCKLQSLRETRRSLTSPTYVRYASGGTTPFTEKIRRKIWGTDKPPGLADPYGGESRLEKRLRERREALSEEVEEEAYTAEEGDVVNTTLPEGYKPAETWDGLEHVGSSGHWSEKLPTENDQYVSFINPAKLTRRREIRKALEQATVEILLLKQSGRDLNGATLETLDYGDNFHLIQQCDVLVSSPGPDSTPEYTVGGLDDVGREIILTVFDQAIADAAALAEEKEVAKQARIRARIQSQLEEAGISQDTAEEPLQQEANPVSDAIAEEANERSTIAPSQPQQEPSSTSANPQSSAVEEIIAHEATLAPSGEPANPSDIRLDESKPIEAKAFLSLPLSDDPHLKFHLLKRASQLTGHRIADPVLPTLRTVGSLYHHLVAITAPKPSKMADMLLKKKELAQLPNVRIEGRRQTIVDRERSVGRWKVIERELVERGLPVVGPKEPNWGQ